jgi:nucleotide-binding universal stress UspA family protein
MIKFTRILHPTDFSDNSHHALRYACDLAERFNAELHVLNVIQTLAMVAPPYDGMAGGDFYETLRRQVEEQMSGLPGSVQGFKGKVVREIREGRPFVEIIRYAKEREIDLIVMATHGRTGMEHLLIGSVAENTVRKADCPILTVPVRR